MTRDVGERPVRLAGAGHIHLTPDSSGPVYDELVCCLRGLGDRPVVGVTCLADGADQLFARAVLAVGGRYEAILPAQDYRSRVIPPHRLRCFDELVARASSVRYAARRSGWAAYAAASSEILRRADRLVAVWDGSETGGTADVVGQARRMGLPVTVVWPAGAARVDPPADGQPT